MKKIQKMKGIPLTATPPKDTLPCITVIATGGTIAGSARSGTATGYASGQITVEAMVSAVPEIETLDLKTAQSLAEFAKKGGKIIFIEKKPFKSPSYIKGDSNDKEVERIVDSLLQNKNVIPLISCRGYWRMHLWGLKGFLRKCGARMV